MPLIILALVLLALSLFLDGTSADILLTQLMMGIVRICLILLVPSGIVIIWQLLLGK